MSVIRFRVTFICWLDASISMANPGGVFSRIHVADERSIYHKFWFYKLKSQQRGNRSNFFWSLYCELSFPFRRPRVEWFHPL